MRQIAYILLLALLISIFGCSSKDVQVKNEAAKPSKRENVTTKGMGKMTQSKDNLLLLLIIPKYNDSQTQVVKTRALPVHWNMQTGDVSFEEKSSPMDQFAGNPLWVGNQVERLEHVPSLPNEVNGVRLLFFGSSDNYVELVGYDYQLKDTGMVIGKLLVGELDGSGKRWREVKGNYLSPAAAYTPDAIKVGSKIYLDGKSGFTVKVIDLEKDPLELSDYELTNKLIGQVEDELAKDAQGLSLLHFGSNHGTLLIEAGGNSKWWVWAIQNDKCIGNLFISSKDKKLTSYKDGKVINEKLLSDEPSGVRLPRNNAN